MNDVPALDLTGLGVDRPEPVDELLARLQPHRCTQPVVAVLDVPEILGGVGALDVLRASQLRAP